MYNRENIRQLYLGSLVRPLKLWGYHGMWVTVATIFVGETLGRSVRLLQLEVVGSLLVDDVPARKIFLAEVDGGLWLVGI